MTVFSCWVIELVVEAELLQVPRPDTRSKRPPNSLSMADSISVKNAQMVSRGNALLTMDSNIHDCRMD